MNIRTGLVVGLIGIYIVLGIIDLSKGNVMTGVASLALSLATGCLFIGAK